MDWSRWPWTRNPKPGRTLTLEEAALFHRPLALRLFGAVNVVVALFYALLGTYGVLKLMFFPLAAGAGFAINDMILILERSAAHSLLGGAAFAIDFVTNVFARIAARRRDESAKPPRP